MNSQLSDLPVYPCNRIDREINVSGKIDDPVWKTAQVIRLVDNMTGGSPDQLTEVRILYSSSSLFISFYCEDDYIWGTHEERNSPIYNEECVEVFINPANSEHQYYELNVSPRNTVFDACILSNRLNQKVEEEFIGLTDYNPDIRTEVYVEGDFNEPGKGRFWSVEYAIPFKELFGAPNLIPIPGDRWRLNLFRIDSPVQGNVRYYAWSHTGKINFHLPWKFGILHFK